jgi:hypothetical protein
MQAMRAALSGAATGSWSTQLPVQIIDRASMDKNSIVDLLTRGELQVGDSPGADLHVAP